MVPISRQRTPLSILSNWGSSSMMNLRININGLGIRSSLQCFWMASSLEPTQIGLIGFDALIGPIPIQHHQSRMRQDINIQPNRPMGNIVAIQLLQINDAIIASPGDLP